MNLRSACVLHSENLSPNKQTPKIIESIVLAHAYKLQHLGSRGRRIAKSLRPTQAIQHETVSPKSDFCKQFVNNRMCISWGLVFLTTPQLFQAIRHLIKAIKGLQTVKSVGAVRGEKRPHSGSQEELCCQSLLFLSLKQGSREAHLNPASAAPAHVVSSTLEGSDVSAVVMSPKTFVDTARGRRKTEAVLLETCFYPNWKCILQTWRARNGGNGVDMPASRQSAQTANRESHVVTNFRLGDEKAYSKVDCFSYANFQLEFCLPLWQKWRNQL